MTDVNECLESSKKNTTYFLTDSNSSEIITSEYNGLQTSVKDVVSGDLNCKTKCCLFDLKVAFWKIRIQVILC